MMLNPRSCKSCQVKALMGLCTQRKAQAMLQMMLY